MDKMTTGSAPTAPAAGKNWDQIMLAMDVVDTLRHREAEIDRIVDQQTDDVALLERVKRIYEAQGIEVPARVIRDAVAALKEDRFIYQPPSAGFRRRLATWYVTRRRWGKKAAIGAAAAAAIGGGVLGYDGYQNIQQSGLHSHFEAVAEQAATHARTEPAKAAVAAATETARGALITGGDSATLVIDQLEQLGQRIAVGYKLRIVSERDERSAVYRHPPGRPDIRNYYLIVDALNASNKPVKVLVTSEEDNAARLTSRFGVRVSAAAYERVKADKSDDGIIQDNIIGNKPRGALSPEYLIDSDGSAIFKW